MAECSPAAAVEVAAGVIFRAGKILACERPAGKPLAGGWEFPGGKLEPGETPETALRRELAEELALPVRVFDEMYRIESVGANGRRLVLHFLRAHAAADVEPTACEKQRFRWLAPSELDSVAWLATDREFVNFLQ